MSFMGFFGTYAWTGSIRENTAKDQLLHSVGRHASAGTDWNMNPEMLTYSRSKSQLATNAIKPKAEGSNMLKHCCATEDRITPCSSGACAFSMILHTVAGTLK
jgi:hypothetical protein